MQTLLARAETVSSLLKARKETIAIAESSTGGLIAAALLAMPGASAYFLGGAVVYTRVSRQAFLDIPEADLATIRPATEAYALLLARHARRRLGTVWGLGETGATGPTGNRYGDPAGHSSIAVAGPAERWITLETGQADRIANMRIFAASALDLLRECLST
ncbi:MAG: CinA family protein [Proteobacteria bacterium]|nr:CinA family protein [Pseudomonadota bacterium]